MPDIDVLTAAIQARAWWPIVGLLAAVIVQLTRAVLPAYWDQIPTRWKPVPALVLVALAALADGFARGDTWPTALGLAVFQLASAWPVALGTADAALRLSGIKSPSVATVAKQGGGQ
jgi:hypothetical protein